jgi:predicted MFS family arabinose efflux permease
MSLFALLGFSAFLFVNTQYLQDIRGLSPLAAGVCLVPLGVVVTVLSPLTGRLVAARGPRLPLAISGIALALGGAALLTVGPTTALSVVVAIYLLFGIALATIIAPVTYTAVSGLPASMAALATSLPSTARQTGTTLGVAIAGTVIAPALAGGATAFVDAARAVWWLIVVLGVAVLALAVASTGRQAQAAAMSLSVDPGAAVPVDRGRASR